MRISVAYDFVPKQHTVAASQVMDHFGISFEQGRYLIAEGLELPIELGQIVLFTGASGSGKSSLMRAVAVELQTGMPATRGDSPSNRETKPVVSQIERRSSGERETAASAGETVSASLSPSRALSPSMTAACHPRLVISLEDLVLPNSLLIDALRLPVREAMNLLAACGLGEAHLMLRTPAELSDGQRYRFRLALALSQGPQWVIADEFTATLDRTLAKVIAYNIRRLSDRSGVGFLLATTHEDVTDDLQPDLHVCCRLDGEVQVVRRSNRQAAGAHEPTPSVARAVQRLDSMADKFGPRKKKRADRSPSPPNSGCPQRPVATGRTSLGGITAVITSDLSAR